MKLEINLNGHLNIQEAVTNPLNNNFANFVTPRDIYANNNLYCTNVYKRINTSAHFPPSGTIVMSTFTNMSNSKSKDINDI